MLGNEFLIVMLIGILLIVLLAIISGLSLKEFSVYENSGVYEVVKKGWSWPGFFFWWVWAFIKRLWLVGVISIVIVISLTLAIQELIIKSKHEIEIMILILKSLVMIIFGLLGNTWIENKVQANGFKFVGTVTAKNVDQAKTLAAQAEVGSNLKDAQIFEEGAIKEAGLPVEPVSTAWSLYGWSGPLARTVVDLTIGPLIIGRDPKEANLIIPSNPSISRRHCIIGIDDDKQNILLEDCGSKNGTFLENGTRLEMDRTYQLKDGDRFYLVTPDNLFEICKHQQGSNNVGNY